MFRGLRPTLDRPSQFKRWNHGLEMDKRSSSITHGEHHAYGAQRCRCKWTMRFDIPWINKDCLQERLWSSAAFPLQATHSHCVVVGQSGQLLSTHL